jgi:hypothetical protein
MTWYEIDSTSDQLPFRHVQGLERDKQLAHYFRKHAPLHPKDQAYALLSCFYPYIPDFYLDAEGQGSCAKCLTSYNCHVTHACIQCPWIGRRVLNTLQHILETGSKQLRHGVCIEYV